MDEIITAESAFENFSRGIACSMTVFGECAPALGLSKEEAYKIATGFGGGMGVGGVCGCVTGALMALGLKYGVSGAGQSEQDKEYHEKRAEFYKAFLEKAGTLKCPEILEGLDITNPKEKAQIVEKGLLRSKCAEYASFAVETLADIMDL